MSNLNWAIINDGGVFESLMHAILYADNVGVVLFGRPGKDSGQDARSADGRVVYQAKYRQDLNMDGAIKLALKELVKIREYRTPSHANHKHWKDAENWVLVGNFLINPEDHSKWQIKVVPAFRKEGLAADYWSIEKLEEKLNELPHIREGFFEGTSRVLVGLSEAFNLLEAESFTSTSLELPLFGQKEIQRQIADFVQDDKMRLLPIVGAGGVGKSRILFESLSNLSDKGWRVYWALPATMSRSDRWFQLFSYNQPTCIALDSPDDPGLLQVIIEQLATVERSRWKILFSCRTEKSRMLRRYQSNSMVAPALKLMPLDESHSIELLKVSLKNAEPVDQSWLHRVYEYTNGVPSWLLLVAGLANRGVMPELWDTSDVVADVYVEDCINELSVEKREIGRAIIRWLACWGTLCLDKGQRPQREIQFLNDQGIAVADMEGLLQELASTGLVSNWGIGKRMFAVKPAIIREHIVSNWLLNKCQGEYQISREGHNLISLLVKEKIPAPEKILSSLSSMSLTRLSESEGFKLFDPLFQALERLANEGTILDQIGILRLIENAGYADPERALYVLKSLRLNQTPNAEVDIPLWGPRTFTHAGLLTELPWSLFQLTESVTSEIVASKYLLEFGELANQEDTWAEKPERGKQTGDLLERLLCESRNSILFARPASQFIRTYIEDKIQWPFVGLLIDSLLNPERQSLEWVSAWRLVISRRAIHPSQEEWELAAQIRDTLFNVHRTSTDHATREWLWNSLSKSHHAFHRMVMYRQVEGEIAQAYCEVLLGDLQHIINILDNPPTPIGIKEAVAARSTWEWYLKYGREDDPIDLAKRCEEIYSERSKWQLHQFFEFRDTALSTSEAKKIVNILREARDTITFEQFFEEVNEYLNAARDGGKDGADLDKLMMLANELSDQLIFTEGGDNNPLTSFVSSVLQQGSHASRGYDWLFVVFICKSYVKHLKDSGVNGGIKAKLQEIVSRTPTKAEFLSELYLFAHKNIIGDLTHDELDIVWKQKDLFTKFDWFTISGTFSVKYFEKIYSSLFDLLVAGEGHQAELSESMERFVRAAYVSHLRYSEQPAQSIVLWIINCIKRFHLDGKILGMHELSWLRDKSGTKLPMSELFELLRSRIELDNTDTDVRDFDVLPHDFPVDEWCEFDAENTIEVSAYYNICKLIFESGFTSSYWIPKFIPKLDGTGRYTADFVGQYFGKNPNMTLDELATIATLASGYADTSDAWVRVAAPICDESARFRRDQRERIYYYLSKKEIRIVSSTPGEPAKHYFEVCDIAARMLEGEQPSGPLREYREWALRRAESDLKAEKERAEEVSNG